MLLCLAQDPDNELMWAHYCSSYKGMVIGIETDLVPILNNGKKFKVIYNSRPPKIKFKYDMRPNEQVSWDMIRTKNKIWSYEREIRYIFDKRGYNKDSYTVGNVDFIKIPNNAIRGVHFSPLASELNVKTAINLLGTDRVLKRGSNQFSYGLT